MRILVAVLVVVLIMIPESNAQKAPLPLKDIEPVASKALQTFAQLVTDKNFKAMGFESTGEVREASLGVPLQEFMIRLDELKEYQIDTDPERLLKGGERAVYPILAKEQVRSSIVIAKKKDDWKTVSFGGANLIRILAETRAKSSKATELPLKSYFIVRVPALKLYFIGHKVEEELLLTPVLDNKSFEFKAGGTMPATRALAAILPAAREHDGLPR